MYLFLGKTYHSAVGCTSCEELLMDSFSSLESGFSFAFYSFCKFLAVLIHPMGYTCPKITLNSLKMLGF